MNERATVCPMRMLGIVHELDSACELLGNRARECGWELDEIVVSESMPNCADGYDAILIMGASPSVNDTHIQPWFQREVALIRDADQRNIPILGICFGAQALAVALGGSVQRAPEPEIGWFTIATTDEDLIAPGPWFEWHVDAITVPPGAHVIATSPVCVQAYTLGRHLAVQFHPEVTSVNVGDWSRADQDTLVRLRLSGESLVAETVATSEQARKRADQFFDRFVRHAGLAQSAEHPNSLSSSS